MKAKKLFLTLSVLFSITYLFANTYYISNNGDNSNDGLSDLNAFQTLAQAALVYQTGDTLLFRRGDVFREESDITFTEIYIATYGDVNDPDPKISGAEEITGWTLWQDNIYMADYSQAIHNLFVDNKIQLYARYPNSGWIRPVNTSGSNIIQTDILSSHPNNANDYWNGAKMRWRRWSWWFEYPTITDYSSNGNVTISGGFGSNAVPGWAFYIDNKFEELDSVGEWYQNASNKIYVKLPDGTTPDEFTIEGGVFSKGFRVLSSTVKDLCFTMQSGSGLEVTGSSLIDGCTFENIGSNSGGTAISGSWSVKNTIIENCIFRNNLNLAISWNEDNSHGGSNIIRNNQFINIGSIPGYGGTGPYHAAGIIITNGRNIHVEHNYFENVGYAGTIFSSKGNYCEYNIFRHCMATLNDGGAIYTNCDSTVIRYNLIYDTEGNMESSAPWPNLGHGIWPEFLSNYKETTIEHNTVIGSGGYGIFLPNNYDCIINNNTLFSNSRAQMGISGTTYPDQNHVIEDNIFFCQKPNQKALNFEEDFDYGSFNNNYYGNMYDRFPIISSKNINYTPEHYSNIYSWADTQFETDIKKISKYRSWNHGDEIIKDSSFATGVSNWVLDDASATADINYNTQNKLDGNCLELDYNGPLVILEYNNIWLGKDQFYEIAFSFQFNTIGDLNSSSERVFNLYVNDESGAVIYSETIPVLVDRNDVKIIFQSDVSAKATIKFFLTSNFQNKFWLDNVSLKPVFAHAIDYEKESIIICNDSLFTRKFLPNEGKWVMIDGTEVTDSISIEAFKSVILIRNDKGQLDGTPPINDAPFPNNIINNSQYSSNISVYPNPFTNYISITSDNVIRSIKIISLDSKETVLSRSVNSNSIILKPDIPSGMYIIKIIDNKGRISNSKLLKI